MKKPARMFDTSNGDEVQRTDATGVDETAVMGGNPALIVRQERQGQSALAANQQLPTKGLEGLREAFEAEDGRVFRLTPGDPAFTDVALPSGWAKRPTDHPLYTDLLDSQGRCRAKICYKAAFYDRWAETRSCCRVSASVQCVDYDDEAKLFFAVIASASGAVLWRGPTEAAWTRAQMQAAYAKANADKVPHAERPKDADERLRAYAVETLKTALPLCDEASAYWGMSDEDVAAKLPASAPAPAGESYVIGAACFRNEAVEARGEKSGYSGDSYDSYGDCYRSFDGMMISRERRKQAKPEFRLVLDWESASWKVRAFPDDDAARKWVADNARRLFAGRAARVELTVKRGAETVASLSYDF